MNNINFSPFTGIETNVNVNKLSPKLIMVIGLLLAVYGLYQHLNKEETK